RGGAPGPWRSRRPRQGRCRRAGTGGRAPELRRPATRRIARLSFPPPTSILFSSDSIVTARSRGGAPSRPRGCARPRRIGGDAKPRPDTTGMQANFSSQTLAEIFRDLYLGERSGVLEIARGNVEKRIYFDRGMILFAESGADDEDLGRRLVNEGKISPG